MDEFWAIALLSRDECAQCPNHHNEDDTDAQQVDSAPEKLKTYKLEGGISLHVSELPEQEGVYSPLGAHAWHASILLGTYLIRNLSNVLPRDPDNTDELTALELGSGAVGVSGIVLAAALSTKHKHATVMLTDVPDSDILNHLRTNVNRNQYLFTDNVNVHVQALDWMEYLCSTETPAALLPPLQLVIGSELVYSKETAHGCASIVARLLKDNPKLVVMILQVMDRPGLETDFLPNLTLAGFHVSIQQPLDAELHERASLALGNEKLGGTLDRFAYGLCTIQNKPMK